VCTRIHHCYKKCPTTRSPKGLKSIADDSKYEWDCYSENSNSTSPLSFPSDKIFSNDDFDALIFETPTAVSALKKRQNRYQSEKNPRVKIRSNEGEYTSQRTQDENSIVFDEMNPLQDWGSFDVLQENSDHHMQRHDEAKMDLNKQVDKTCDQEVQTDWSAGNHQAYFGFDMNSLLKVDFNELPFTTTPFVCLNSFGFMGEALPEISTFSTTNIDLHNNVMNRIHTVDQNNLLLKHKIRSPNEVNNLFEQLEHSKNMRYDLMIITVV
jgi:hypothetical protein